MNVYETTPCRMCGSDPVHTYFTNGYCKPCREMYMNTDSVQKLYSECDKYAVLGEAHKTKNKMRVTEPGFIVNLDLFNLSVAESIEGLVKTYGLEHVQHCLSKARDYFWSVNRSNVQLHKIKTRSMNRWYHDHSQDKCLQAIYIIFSRELIIHV